MIIARYITKEILWTFLGITLVLFCIALSNRFALYLAKAATGELPISLVFNLVWLYTPELLSIVIPLSFFVAILFAFGRLYADNEMTVLSACGLGWGYISRITLTFSFIIMLLVASLTLWWVPKMTAYREKVLYEGEAMAMIHNLIPGRFQTLSEGDLVFYLEDLSKETETIKGIFIAELSKQGSGKGTKKKSEESETLITAEKAHVERSKEKEKEKDQGLEKEKDKEKDSQNFYLVLKQGTRYQGHPGSADYTVTEFKEYGRAVQPASLAPPAEAIKQKESAALLESKKLEDKAEFQWRMSVPLSVPILALLAIPLAKVRPRQGRYAKFLPAIVLFIVYYNLFTVSKRWVAAGSIPGFVGVWWVHALFLLLALILLAKGSGFLRSHFAPEKRMNKRKNEKMKERK